MYYFTATYDHMDTCKTHEERIQIEDQFFDNEKGVFLAAMEKAYGATPEGCQLVLLEFLAC